MLAMILNMGARKVHEHGLLSYHPINVMDYPGYDPINLLAGRVHE